MTKPILGQIVTMAASRCPHCGQPPNGGQTVWAIEKVWDGNDWILLDSWEGHALADKLSKIGIESSIALRVLEARRQAEQREKK